MSYITVKSGYLTGSSPGTTITNNGGLRMYYELRCYNVAETATIMNKSYSCAAGSYKLYYKLQGWFGIQISSKVRLTNRTNTSNTSYVRLRNGTTNLWYMEGGSVSYAVQNPSFGDNNPANSWYNVSDASDSDYRVYPEGLISVTEGATLSLNLDYAIGLWYSSSYSANVTATSSSTSVSVSGGKYTLSISASNSSVTVQRTGGAATGTLTTGAAIYTGDKLKITFTANSGYTIANHTVNGSTFTSGATHTVSGNVSVVSTATQSTFTLSISAGTGSSITVKRSGTTLSNGATLNVGDVLTITFSASSGYQIATHTVNGSSFTSGNTHTVSANVSVVSTATVKPSTASASSGYIGQANTITVTQYNTSWTHTITAAILGRTETIATKSSNTSLSWTPALATYAPLMTTSMSTTVTLTCQTYNGNTRLGTTTSTFAISLRAADVKPTVSVSVSDGTNNYSTYGAFVATKSTYVVTATPTFRYGATQKALTITANGATYSSSPATTSVIASASNTTITAKVTDSRSQSSDTVTVTKTVLAYENPSVSINIGRCDQDGTANDSGAYMKITATYAVSPLNSQNSKTVTFKRKKTSVSTYTTENVTPSSYSGSTYKIYAADTTDAYDVQVSVTDDFTTSTITRQLSSGAVRPMSFQSGGRGVGFGVASNIQDSVQIAEDWELYFGTEAFKEHAQKQIDQVGELIPTNSDLNDFNTPGCYVSEGTTKTASLSHVPSDFTTDFRLEVLSSGSTNYSGSLMQFAWSSYSDAVYMRRRRSGGWGAWRRFLVDATDELQAGTLTVSNSVTLVGYITDGSKEMTFDYVLPRITHCSNVSVTKFKGNVRGVNGGSGGYVDSSSSTSIDWYGTGYTTTVTKIGINRVRITVRKSTAFSNATNNTPIAFFGQITLVFS